MAPLDWIVFSSTRHQLEHRIVPCVQKQYQLKNTEIQEKRTASVQHSNRNNFRSSILQLLYKMALRGQSELSSKTIRSSLLSHIVVLPIFWHDANASPTMEWEKWLHLLQVAIQSKYSISISKQKVYAIRLIGGHLRRTTSRQ